MKGFIFLAVTLSWLGTANLAPAQSFYPTPPAVSGSSVTREQIISRIKALEARINADSKTGKLTTDQADSLLAGLQTIKDKKKADYAENGKKELTADQKTELSSMLDGSEASLVSPNGFGNTN